MRIPNQIRDFFTKIAGQDKQLRASDILSRMINESFAVRHDGVAIVEQNEEEIYLADLHPERSRPNFCFAVRRGYSCWPRAIVPFWSGMLYEQNNLPALQGILCKLPPTVGHVRIALSFGDLGILPNGTEVFRFCSPMKAQYIFLEYWVPFIDSRGGTDADTVEHWLERESPENWLRTKSVDYGKNFYFYFRFDELTHATEAELLELREYFQKEVGKIGGIEILDPACAKTHQTWSSVHIRYKPLSSCR